MQARRVFILLLIIALVGTAYYFLTTERSKGLTLIGTVDANQVIVSSNIQGRIEKLLVDEGTDVKAGDPIAVIDSSITSIDRLRGERKLGSRSAK